MGIDYKMIGSRIKTKRKEARLTQEQLAERVSVTVGYISQIERGITKPNLEMLAQLCTVLGCDLPYLTDGVILGAKDYLSDEIYKKFALLSEKSKTMISDIIDIILKNE